MKTESPITEMLKSSGASVQIVGRYLAYKGDSWVVWHTDGGFASPNGYKVMVETKDEEQAVEVFLTGEVPCVGVNH